jgi:hypothetical protein
MAEDGHAARAIAEGVRRTFDDAVAHGDPQALVPELVALLTRRGDGR